MSLNKIQYKTDETIITAENLNDIQDEVIRLDDDKFDKSGGILSGNVKMDTTSKGYYLTDKTGVSYPGIYDNGSNLWIGTTKDGAVNHIGGTYISSGYDNTNSKGYATIVAGVPKFGNDGSSLYNIWHDGYINYDKLYPVGACYTTFTKTDPSTMFPGTTWTLIDKRFRANFYGSSTDEAVKEDIFTINTTNVGKLNWAYVVKEDHQVQVFLSIYIKVAVGEGSLTLGTFNLDTLGMTGMPFTSVGNAYADGFNGIALCQVTGSGTATHVDLINKGSSKTSVTATETAYIINMTFFLTPDRMLDNYCNQFIWKRTA